MGGSKGGSPEETSLVHTGRVPAKGRLKRPDTRAPLCLGRGTVAHKGQRGRMSNGSV